MTTRIVLVISTVAGAGYAPIAPGTVGSAVALAIFVAVRATGSFLVEGAVLLACSVLGTWAATRAERHFGTADPGPVVIDEVLGMLVTLAFLPVSWSGVLAGFLLFRIFDIIKPWPADHLERLPHGLGIMADDVAAGVYAQLVLRGLIWVGPGWISSSGL